MIKPSEAEHDDEEDDQTTTTMNTEPSHSVLEKNLLEKELINNRLDSQQFNITIYKLCNCRHNVIHS